MLLRDENCSSISRSINDEEKTVYNIDTTSSGNAKEGKKRAEGERGAADDEGQVETVDFVQDTAQEGPDHQSDAEHGLHEGQDS